MNAVDYQILGYQYDASSRLIKQWTEVKGEDLIGAATGIVRAETTYEYDKNGNILSITSPEGYKTTYTYDAANRLITKSEEVSEDWLNDTNVKASITSPFNRIYEGQTYTYKINIDPQEDVKGLNLILEFDSRVFEPVATTPSVVGVTIKPSSLGRISITATDQTITSKTEIATLSLKVKPGFTGIGYINFSKYSTYTDSSGKSKPLTELEGQSMDLTGPDMNNDGKVEANDLTLTALRQDMDSSHPEYEYQYDINGNSTIDLADVDYITDWIFKDKSATLQQLGHSIFTLKVINSQYQKGANTVIRTTTYNYDKAGNMVSETDSTGQTITYVYDAGNQLIKNIDKEGNTYRYFYDEVGNIIKEVLPTHYNSGTDNGLGTTYIYDAMGNLTQVLDAEGNVVQTNSYNAKRQLLSQVDGENYATTYTYDLGGRILTVATPESSAKGKVSVSYTYNALNKILTHTDGENHTTTYVRDLWGRATQVANAKVIIEYYTYDFMGNILTSKDGKGYTTTYTFNALNQLKTVTNPSNHRIQYKYDKEGRLAQETDKKGEVITYTYNSDSHITSKSAASNVINENYLYNKEGRLFATITSNGIERYQYKPNGNLEKKTLNGHEQLTYNYNKAGQVTQLTDSENQSILYGYDTVGRIKTVSDGTNNLATYTYNRDNTIADVTFDTGVKTIYGYDKDNQITGLMHQKGDGTPINSFSYTYDNSGNLTQKVENGQATSYTYDAIDQLVGVNYPSVGQETYTYDNAGNRTQKTLSGVTSTYQYNTLNQLTSLTENGTITSYTYDLNGNMIKEATGNQTTDHNYDAFNRLTSTAKSDGSWQKNYYNALGLRSAVEENGIYTGFVNDGWNVLAETNIHNDITAKIISGNGLIAQRDQKGKDYYYLQNAHGDVVNLIDKAGTIKNNYQYDAFGNTTEEELVSNRYAYAGEQYDGITGNYYLRARYYNPTVGRFLQEDTFRGDGLNLYAYVANNPINYVDPSGHSKCEDVAKSIALGVLAGVSNNGFDTLNNLKGIVEALAENDKGFKVLQRSGQIDEMMKDLESHAPDKVAFYASKTLMDGLLLAIGIYGTAVGIQTFITGAGTTFTGIGALVPSGGSSTVVVAGGLAVSAVGVLETGVSASLAFSALSNGKDDLNSLMKAIKDKGTGKGNQPTDFDKVSDNYLKQNEIDAHAVKKEALGTDKGNSLYDIYVDKETGQLWVFRKGGVGEGIPTGEFIK